MGGDRFSVAPLPSALARLYGGQVLAQALQAARMTVGTNRGPANCHACFLAPGAIDLPIELSVTRDADGRSFSTRRVVASQSDTVILTMTATFHAAEPDAATFAEAMPDVAPPESLEPMETVLARTEGLPDRHKPFWLRDHMFEYRSVQPFRPVERDPEPNAQQYWVRLKEPWHGPASDHAILLAYMSDLHTLHVGLAPLGLAFGNHYLQTSSLDHAIWYHRDVSVDDWLLYSLRSPAAAQAVALGTGNIFTRDGTLVASTAQSGLIRMHDKPRVDGL